MTDNVVHSDSMYVLLLKECTNQKAVGDKRKEAKARIAILVESFLSIVKNFKNLGAMNVKHPAYPLFYTSLSVDATTLTYERFRS